MNGQNETGIYFLDGTREDIVLDENYDIWDCTKYMRNPMIKKIVFPNDLRCINHKCFIECTSLEEVVFPKELCYIGVQAFKGCTSLISIDIPCQVDTICAGAFEDCINLEKVTLPTNEIVLKSCVFKNCTKLNNISLPYRYKEIAPDAFFGSNIKELSLSLRCLLNSTKALIQCPTIDTIHLIKKSS